MRLRNITLRSKTRITGRIGSGALTVMKLIRPSIKTDRQRLQLNCLRMLTVSVIMHSAVSAVRDMNAGNTPVKTHGDLCPISAVWKTEVSKAETLKQ